MRSRTNKDKCMFQHNGMKSQNRKDTKNAVKALRENADHVRRNKNQTGIIFFKQSLLYSPSFLLLVAGHSFQHNWDCSQSLTLESGLILMTPVNKT